MPENLDLMSLQTVLDSIRNQEWQIPRFQRSFVWVRAQVQSLVDSIISSRPIGMVTLWASPPEPQRNLFEPFTFLPPSPPHTPGMGVLDGQQRLTSILNVFGGAHSGTPNHRLSGKWFYKFGNVKEEERILFVKSQEFDAQGLSSIGTCIDRAMFPLEKAMSIATYLAELRNPNHYPAGAIPGDIDTRIETLSSLLSVLTAFRLPVYVVPAATGLNEVCDMFEYLNTSGTKVSIFDLIAAKHYPSGFDLHEWYRECGSTKGLSGWCSGQARPQWFNRDFGTSYTPLDPRELTLLR
jgi:hypothetical protein